jgi:lysyl-tRNA synthetase class II
VQAHQTPLIRRPLHKLSLRELAAPWLLLLVCPPIQGSYKIQYHANGFDKPAIEIDFSRPWKRISMVSGLEEALGVKFPADLESAETRTMLVSARRDRQRQVAAGAWVCVSVSPALYANVL